MRNRTLITESNVHLPLRGGQPPTEQSSITIISKTKLPMPSTPIYTKYVYQKNNLEEDPSRSRSFYQVFLHLTYSSLLLGLINIDLYYMEIYYSTHQRGQVGQVPNMKALNTSSINLMKVFGAFVKPKCMTSIRRDLYI